MPPAAPNWLTGEDPKFPSAPDPPDEPPPAPPLKKLGLPAPEPPLCVTVPVDDAARPRPPAAAFALAPLPGSAMTDTESPENELVPPSLAPLFHRPGVPPAPTVTVYALPGVTATDVFPAHADPPPDDPPAAVPACPLVPPPPPDTTLTFTVVVDAIHG